MQNTTNYNLNKPDGNDYAKIQALNENADIIDAALQTLADALGDIDLATLSQAIANVDNRVTTHLDDIMPHRFVDGSKTYRWGFRTVNGEPQMIYEEV